MLASCYLQLDAMRALDHQNIVRLLGGSSSTDTGQFALLMDLYPEDMESALQAEEPVEWEEKLSWVRPSFFASLTLWTY